jgi:hypothetical protein
VQRFLKAQRQEKSGQLVATGGGTPPVLKEPDMARLRPNAWGDLSAVLGIVAIAGIVAFLLLGH